MQINFGVAFSESLCAVDVVGGILQLETQPWYFEAEDKYDCEQKVRAVGQVRT